MAQGAAATQKALSTHHSESAAEFADVEEHSAALSAELTQLNTQQEDCAAVMGAVAPLYKQTVLPRRMASRALFRLHRRRHRHRTKSMT